MARWIVFSTTGMPYRACADHEAEYRAMGVIWSRPLGWDEVDRMLADHRRRHPHG